MNIHSRVSMDKRAEILQAALNLFVERGFHGAPMAEIAQEARVAAGTIYRYFPSKDDLINELFREVEKDLREAVRARYPSEGPIQEKYEYLLRESIRYLTDHPRHFLYLEQYYNSPYGETLHRDKILGREKDNLWWDIFERGVETGVIKDLPRGVLFALAFGPMIVLLRDQIRGFISLGEEDLARFTAASWDAINR
jgi:AcrR family transcriptional regulator